jgi:hypothetical protein
MLLEVPDCIGKQVLDDIDRATERAKRRVAKVKQYSSEEGLNQGIKDHEFADFNGMIGRYGDYSIDETLWSGIIRVFCEYRELGELCPVVMAGSKWFLHRLYSKTIGGSNANGWKERVARRYLRMIKHTSLGWDKEREKHYTIIAQWVGHGTWGKFNNPLSCGDDVAYIHGRRCFVRDAEMLQSLKSLLRHIHKINYIDKCLKQLGASV